MRDLAIIIVILVSVLNVNAQVFYTANDYGTAGDVYQQKIKRLAEGNEISIDDVDPQMWDLSSLAAVEIKDNEILGVNAFDELSSLPQDCMLIETIMGSYQILKVEDNVLYQYGIYALVNGQHTPLVFDDPVSILEFPLVADSQLSSSFTTTTSGKPKEFGVNESALDSMRFITSIVMSSQVLDDGELFMPVGNCMALKVLNTFEMNIDVWVKPPMGDWSLYQQSMVNEAAKELDYYTVDYGIPVAKVKMNLDNEITDYMYINMTSSGIVLENNNSFSFYPNPAKSGTLVYFDDQVQGVELFDLLGRKLYAVKANAKSLLLPNLAPGNYILRVPGSILSSNLIIR